MWRVPGTKKAPAVETEDADFAYEKKTTNPVVIKRLLTL